LGIYGTYSVNGLHVGPGGNTIDGHA
jgi:hypothetical protein